MRASRPDEALAILLDPDVAHNLSLAQYQKWAEALWDILEQDAERRSVGNCRGEERSTKQLCCVADKTMKLWIWSGRHDYRKAAIVKSGQGDHYGY